jgi:hypothetical protein
MTAVGLVAPLSICLAREFFPPLRFDVTIGPPRAPPILPPVDTGHSTQLFNTRLITI